ncbi:MAG TPA: hypothetical protein VL092_11905 [Chitinophagaceae bacterium]|nr:hypothetical protein [Chitinophagaceae bacterium]
MKVYRIIVYLLFAGVLAGTPARAADKAAVDKVLEVLKAMRSMSVYGYNYSVKNTYPTGQVDKAAGTAQLDLVKKMIAEKGDYSTTILNDKWYFKAEHTSKDVTVVYLDEPARKKQLAALNAVLSVSSPFLQDSVFRKYGQIISLSTLHNIVTVKLKFSNVDYLDHCELVFDLAKQLPVSVYVRTVYPGFGGNTIQEATCTRFHKDIPAGCFSVQPYFDIQSGAVSLKQYSTYKRHFEL